MSPPKFSIEESDPTRDFDDHWVGLSLEEAAARMDDLTGVGADVILADWDEDCGRCEGHGSPITYEDSTTIYREGSCPDCHGDGERSEPWEWTDDETGREVTMTKERN